MSSTVQHLRDVAGRYPRLTLDEEIMLGRTIQQWQQWPGGPEAAPRRVQRDGRQALDRFVLCNQRLAIHVAKLYTDCGVDLDDLIMAATEGLIRSYLRFDPSLGYRSGNYAIWWAKQACQKLVHQQSLPVRLPAAAFTLLRKVLKAQDQLMRRKPNHSQGELAAEVGITVEQLEEVLKAFHSVRAVRIDTSRSSDETSGPGTLSEEHLGSTDDAQQRHRRLLGDSFHSRILTDLKLCPRQSRVLQLLYLQDPPLTVRTVATHLNCSPERIRQLEDSGLTALRTGKAA